MSLSVIDIRQSISSEAIAVNKMKNNATIVTVLLFVILTPVLSKLKILAVLPLEHGNRPTSSWERGFEMLPGAQVAIEHINQDRNIIPDNELELEIVDSRDQTLLIDLVMNIFYQDLNPIGIIGLFNSHLLSRLVANKHLLVVDSSPSIRHGLSPADKSKSYCFHMLQPADVFADAFLRLSLQFGWKRIAVVTDFTDSYHLGIAEVLHNRATASNEYSIIPLVQLSEGRSLTSVFSKLTTYHSNIIFLSMGVSEVIRVLCAAKRRMLTWPDFAWIIPSVTYAELVGAEHITTCNIHEALEGVILLNHRLTTDKGILVEEYTYNDYLKNYQEWLDNVSATRNISLSPNAFANLLHDSVWVYALALRSQVSIASNLTSFQLADSIRNTMFSGASGHVQFNANSGRLTGVDIAQVRDGATVHEGFYHPVWKNITFTGNMQNGPLPSSKRVIITDRASPLYTSFLSMCLALCVVFVTFILVLYIYYHKEPEIKSTSSTLSLLMFLGCYIILFYLLLAAIYTQSLVSSTSPFNICMALAWLNISGVSVPLILATLLVKMLRVYHIFTLYGKIGKMCSDTALLTYVLLLMSPCTLVLIFWSAVDPYTAETVIKERPGYTEVEQRCFSKHLLIWIGLLIVNLKALVVAILVVAVKTRKIRQTHFKDTKKVNAFLFIFLLLVFLTVSYWMILRSIGVKKGYTDIILHVSHIIIVLCCQGFLFVPKVIPPLRRSISKRYQLQYGSSQGSSKTHSTAVTLSTI